MTRTAVMSTPSSVQRVQRQVAEKVIAHSADHVGGRTRTYGSNRLIRAFSAQHQGEVGADDRLARPRQGRAEGRQVSVDAAHHRDTCAALHDPLCALLAQSLR